MEWMEWMDPVTMLDIGHFYRLKNVQLSEYLRIFELLKNKVEVSLYHDLDDICHVCHL